MSRPAHAFDIQRRDGDGWHGDIGESQEWPTLKAAERAIDGLRALGDDWLGDYRVVEHESRRVVSAVTLAKNPAAVALGRLGGQAKSERKTLASRANAKKPRPRKQKAQAH